MTRAVTIVDYGVGNLLSVARAFEHCGADVRLTSSPEEVVRAGRLVLPGVGAFRNGMDELERRGLADAVKRYAALERPFLGICLGMQMMLETSEEFGLHRGLGLVPGTVAAIPPNGANVRRKIPHVGWAALHRPAAQPGWGSTIFSDVEEDTAAAYFVHSYAARPADAAHVLATCDYDGCTLTAAVRSGPLYGCQFHPEKSGRVGLSILRRFTELE